MSWQASAALTFSHKDAASASAARAEVALRRCATAFMLPSTRGMHASFLQAALLIPSRRSCGSMHVNLVQSGVQQSSLKSVPRAVGSCSLDGDWCCLFQLVSTCSTAYIRCSIFVVIYHNVAQSRLVSGPLGTPLPLAGRHQPPAATQHKRRAAIVSHSMP